MDVKINGDDNDPLGYKRIAMNADHRLDTVAIISGKMVSVAVVRPNPRLVPL